MYLSEKNNADKSKGTVVSSVTTSDANQSQIQFFGSEGESEQINGAVDGQNDSKQATLP